MAFIQTQFTTAPPHLLFCCNYRILYSHCTCILLCYYCCNGSYLSILVIHGIIMVVSLNYYILLFGNKTIIVKLYIDFYSLLLLPLWKLLIVKGTYPVTA